MNQPVKMTQSKSKFFRIFESALFVLIMCFIALRLSFAENPNIESFSLQGTFYDNFLSVCISSLLIISGAIWMAVKLASGKYRLSGFEYGILIFIIAAVISTIAASNRRAAITDSITILSAMLTGVVLSNLLETVERKKVLLFVLAGMAAANVYQCTEQFSSSNKLMIEQYENEPLSQLRALCIEPGSFQQMLYEHRLYSKDVRGFFTTGNGAGSLLVLAIFCVFAAFDFRVNFTEKKKTLIKLWFPIALLLVLFAGLVMAHSKGAFGSLITAGFLLFLVVRFGNVLNRHRRLIIISVIILIILCTVFIISYGLSHNTLPGGNSMLVRWQYWYSTAKIIADYPVTGVGGGNFATYYDQYKLPQGLESVRDPHCFILSILSQYGIIGLTGFCIALFYPIIKACIRNSPVKSSGNNIIIPVAKVSGISIVLFLLFIRPIFIRVQIGNTIDVIPYIVAIMYVAPAFFAGTTLWLCTRNEAQNKQISQIFRPALLCGLFALLIHNLIDFAIFEPGIMTVFWACIAIIQSDFRSENRTVNETKPNKITKFILSIVPVATGAFILWLCVIPGVKTSFKIEKAKQFYSNGEFEDATKLLNKASIDDILNPTPAAYAGIVLLTKFEMNPSGSPDILMEAEKPLQAAIDRDKADFRNYENLGRVYEVLAQRATATRQSWLKKAFSAFEQALTRYPASSELHFELAKIAQQLNNNDIAIEHYKKAIEIEDSFAQQYKIMYPGRPASSRMGKTKYNEAKEKLEELMQNQENLK